MRAIWELVPLKNSCLQTGTRRRMPIVAVLAVLAQSACASGATLNAKSGARSNAASSCVRFTNESNATARVFLLDGSNQYLLGYVDAARTICLAIPRSLEGVGRRDVTVAAMPLGTNWNATDRVAAIPGLPRSEPWPLTSMQEAGWRFDGRQVQVIQRTRRRPVGLTP